MSDERNLTKHGYVLPRFSDFKYIKNGETTIGYKYDGIGTFLAMFLIFGAVILNVILSISEYMLMHSIACVLALLSMAPVFLIKKDYELYFARRYLAVIGPPIVAVVWFISGGMSSPTGYIWMVAVVAYNSFLVTGNKGKWYVSYAIVINMIAMFLSLTFPQIIKTIENEQKLNWYNFFAVVMVGAYIGITTWFQRKIAENIKNKMDEYNEELTAMNEELTAMNDELQHHMEREVQYKLKEEMMIQQKKQSEKTVNALAYTIDSKDRYTSGHSQRVAKYSLELAKRMGKDEEEQKIIYHAGLLHDVGKIRVPEAVINKPGKLTDEEFDLIKIHPTSGYHTLKNIYDDKQIALGAKYHHERYDGTGYPNNLEGENIPEIARIIGVADAYDAMASNRSYRNALPQEVVRAELEKGKGKQFDPKIAEIMLQMIDEDVNYEMCEKEVVNKDILVVDDEAMNIKMVEFILKDEPVNILSAKSGEEGLRILKEKSLDLVLLDIVMPDMDGFEVFEKIHEITNVPVVFMTADKNLESIKKAAQIGVEDYVVKPFFPLVLKETVHGIVNHLS